MMWRLGSSAILLTLVLVACGQEVQAPGGETGAGAGTGTGTGASSGTGNETATGAGTAGPGCPAQWPSFGTPCPLEGQICEYYDVPCDDGGPSTSHQCIGGVWEEAPTGCSVCPAETPIVGADCDLSLPTYFCEYTVETPCGPETAQMSCGGDGVWERSDPSQCTAACGDFDQEEGCAAAAGCAWLVPGCAEGPNPLAEAGCFPADPCTPDSCDGDATCQTVVYDPCVNSSCNACGAETTVCL